MNEIYDDDMVRQILTGCRRVALVGASDNPQRASYDVMAFLQTVGFVVTPVNPQLAGKEILGQQVVASLQDAGEIDMVDCFRRSEFIPDIAKEAVRLRVPVVWMQLGVFHPEAAQFMRDNGVTVIQDRCPKIEWRRLGLSAS